MRAVIQRVCDAKVTVDQEVTGSIHKGLLVFLGVSPDDTPEDLAWMVDKIVNLRVFEDDQQKMNRSVREVGGSILLISQFTLYGDCRKGRRPSFSQAAQPDFARHMYQACGQELQNRGLKVEYGRFGAMMKVHLVNDGPVTLLLDSKKGF